MFLLIFSCEESIYEVPSDVHQYIVVFEKESKIRGFNYVIDNIQVTFHNNEEMIHAMADTRVKNGRIMIRINTKYWNAYEIYPMRREAIMMHEFGHYPLMRSHNNISNSLMSGQTWSIIDYKKNRDEMLDELFR